MNKRTVPLITLWALLALLFASCTQPALPTPSVPAGATAAPGGAATAAPAPVATNAETGQNTPVAAATAPSTGSQGTPQAVGTVPAPADDSRPLAKLTPAERVDRFSGPAPMSIVTGTRYLATIVTSKGNIVAELYDDTPLSTNNFVTLSKDGFYDGLTFHRVEPGFVIQGGDPKGDGTGGPGYTIPAEIKHKHLRGALAWARTGDAVNPQRASSGSQFYITLADTPNLDGAYTVFGQVVEGMDVVAKIAVGDAIQRIAISTTDVSRLPTPMPPTAPVPAEGRPVATQPADQRGALFNQPPAMTIDPKKSYQATISTAKGDIVINLDTANAPTSVNNFVVLANLGFYDNMPIAYVEPQSAVVLGSPAGRPDSDVGYQLDLEKNAQDSKIITGTVAYYPAINASGQSANKASGSEFFIAMAAMQQLAGPVNVFGAVASGMDVVGKLATGDAVKSVTITEK